MNKNDAPLVSQWPILSGDFNVLCSQISLHHFRNSSQLPNKGMVHNTNASHFKCHITRITFPISFIMLNCNFYLAIVLNFPLATPKLYFPLISGNIFLLKWIILHFVPTELNLILYLSTSPICQDALNLNSTIRKSIPSSRCRGTNVMCIHSNNWIEECLLPEDVNLSPALSS